jgi:uncharacterized protein YcgI (DUF1989 family)
MAEPRVAINALLQASPQVCPTPIKREHYMELAARYNDQVAAVAENFVLDDFSGLAVSVPAGAALELKLLRGPQIVNLFAFNTADPDERMWHQSVIREGIFLKRYSRVWGTMARYRPLLTVLEDTVVADPGWPAAQHHPFYGGSGTPRDWRALGGAPDVPSTWEQFGSLLDALDVPRHILAENLCLFQKSVIDPATLRIAIVPSDAVMGDAVVLFAEIDLRVLVALSPYRDGSPMAGAVRPQPRPVRVSVTEKLGDPLPWPYPDVSYPDLGAYVDASGRRSDDVTPTPGIDYGVSHD